MKKPLRDGESSDLTEDITLVGDCYSFLYYDTQSWLNSLFGKYALFAESEYERENHYVHAYSITVNDYSAYIQDGEWERKKEYKTIRVLLSSLYQKEFKGWIDEGYAISQGYLSADNIVEVFGLWKLKRYEIYSRHARELDLLRNKAAELMK